MHMGIFTRNEKNFLVADIGGTTCRIAIITTPEKENGKGYTIRHVRHYETKKIVQFAQVVSAFLSEQAVKSIPIHGACIACAGPVNAERTCCTGTHIDWTIDISELEAKTPLKKIILLNDFEAIGYALDILKPEQYRELTACGRTSGTSAIIGAGTGLGMSIVPRITQRRLPLPSEGGSSDLLCDPSDPVEMRLYQYLKRKKISRTTESILSGRGLITLYEFFAKNNSKIRKLPQDQQSAFIAKNGMEGRDKAAMRALEYFIRFYARAARTLTLTSLCTELVIAGGIAPKIFPVLQEYFIESYTIHEEKSARKLLEQVTILVIIDEYAGLYGCAAAADARF